jgi:hypothetical protein
MFVNWIRERSRASKEGSTEKTNQCINNSLVKSWCVKSVLFCSTILGPYSQNFFLRNLHIGQISLKVYP